MRVREQRVGVARTSLQGCRSQGEPRGDARQAESAQGGTIARRVSKSTAKRGGTLQGRSEERSSAAAGGAEGYQLSEEIQFETRRSRRCRHRLRRGHGGW